MYPSIAHKVHTVNGFEEVTEGREEGRKERREVGRWEGASAEN